MGGHPVDVLDVLLRQRGVAAQRGPWLEGGRGTMAINRQRVDRQGCHDRPDGSWQRPPTEQDVGAMAEVILQ
eukprot:2541420-Pyramimonas_sp.AAC.1